MSDSDFEFDRSTAVVDGDGAIHDGWDIGGNANGGYLMALAAQGLRNLAGRPDPISMTGHYLSPGRPGPVHVDITKDALTSETRVGHPDTIDLPGYSAVLGTNISNVGGMFVILAPFEERAGHPELSADRVTAQLRQSFREIEEAQAAVFGAPPAVTGAP